VPLTGAVVQLVCLFILAGRVCLDGLLDRLNGAAQEVGVAHGWGGTGLYAAKVWCSGVVLARARRVGSLRCGMTEGGWLARGRAGQGRSWVRGGSAASGMRGRVWSSGQRAGSRERRAVCSVQCAVSVAERVVLWRAQASPGLAVACTRRPRPRPESSPAMLARLRFPPPTSSNPQPSAHCCHFRPHHLLRHGRHAEEAAGAVRGLPGSARR
jgi:hypothetical protein